MVNPFHLHVSTNEAGGGGIEHIIERLQQIEGTDKDYLSPPKYWFINEGNEFQVRLNDYCSIFYSTDHHRLSSRLAWVYCCALDTAKILESLADEVEDIREELVSRVMSGSAVHAAISACSAAVWSALHLALAAGSGGRSMDIFFSITATLISAGRTVFELVKVPASIT